MHPAAEARGRAEIDAQVVGEPGAFDCAAHRQRLVRAQADLVHLVGANAHPERHLVAYSVTHRFEHLVQKAETRPLRAPVLVAAPVDAGIEELRDQVPMVGHHLDPLEARLAHACRCVSVGADHFPDQRARHHARNDLVALTGQRRGGVRDRNRSVVAGSRDVAASGVVELAEGRRPVGPDAFDDPAIGPDARVGVGGGVAPRSDRGGVHRCRLADDEPRPTSRPRLVIRADALVGEPALRHVGTVRGGHDAVAQGNPAQRERREKAGKMLIHGQHLQRRLLGVPDRELSTRAHPGWMATMSISRQNARGNQRQSPHGVRMGGVPVLERGHVVGGTGVGGVVCGAVGLPYPHHQCEIGIAKGTETV